MIIRELDENGEAKFGLGLQNYLRDQEAVILNIKTRLLSFLNNCFFDMNSGIDWFRFLGTRASEQEIVLACRGVILQSFGVIRINRLSVSVLNRRIQIEFNIDTVFTTNFFQSLEVTNA